MKRDDLFYSDDSSQQNSKPQAPIEVKPQPEVLKKQRKKQRKQKKIQMDDDECDQELLRIFPFLRDNDQPPAKKKSISSKPAASSSSSASSNRSEQIASETKCALPSNGQPQQLPSQRKNPPIPPKPLKIPQPIQQPQSHVDVISERQNLRIVLMHLSNYNRRTRAGRVMNEMVRQVKNGRSNEKILTQLKEIDFSLYQLVLKHQQFLRFTTEALFYLTRFKYQYIQDVPLGKKIQQVYKCIGGHVDIKRFILGLTTNRVFIFKDNNVQVKEFLEEVESKVISLMQDSKEKDDAKVMLDELWGGQETKPQQEKTQKKEELIFSPTRMRRTMYMLMRCGFNFTSTNLQFGQDLSTFLLKIIELHAEKLITDVFKVAEISSKESVDKDLPYDQITYFSTKCREKKLRYPSKGQQLHTIQPRINHQDCKIDKLSYPDRMSIYNSLRRKQCEMENALQSTVNGVVQKVVFGKWNRSARKKVVRDYFSTPIPKEIMNTFKDLQEQSQPIKRTTVHLQHILLVLEAHPTYGRHQLVWKMRNLYD